MVVNHGGNWDHAGAWGCLRYGGLTTVAERLKPEGLYERSSPTASRWAWRSCPTGEPDIIRTLARRLKEGRLVPLMGDRDIGRNGVVVDLFGEPASFPAGPAVLGHAHRRAAASRSASGTTARWPPGACIDAVEVPADGHPRGEGPRDHPGRGRRVRVGHPRPQRRLAHDAAGLGGRPRPRPRAVRGRRRAGAAAAEAEVDVKVGLVCPYSWDVPGGVRSHVADLAVALSDHGHEVSVLAPVDDPDDLPPWVVDGGRPIGDPLQRVRRAAELRRQGDAARPRWIRDGDFDILHVHEPVAPSLSILALWVGRAARSSPPGTRRTTGPASCRPATTSARRRWRRSAAASPSARTPAARS